MIQTLDQGRVKARVWTRERLAELCDISEEQVVEWALLMGNDYTEGLSLRPKKLGGKGSRASRVRSVGCSSILFASAWCTFMVC